MTLNKLAKLLAVFAFSLTLFGCDPYHTKECEWYLMPDPAKERVGKADPGFIPVCARNLVVNREDCALQATEELAREYYGKKFRLVDLKRKKEGTFPREVLSIETCGK